MLLASQGAVPGPNIALEHLPEGAASQASQQAGLISFVFRPFGLNLQTPVGVGTALATGAASFAFLG